jgi:hypothetical protein
MGSNANTDVDKLIAFGQMALEQGWYDQAREYFEQVLALDSSNREAMKGLARVNEILSHRTVVKPTEPETKKLLDSARMCLEAGHPEYAHQCFEKVLELDPNNRNAKEALAEIEAVLSRKRLAAEKRKEQIREITRRKEVGWMVIPEKKMAWWERLVFERPKEVFTICMSCGTLNDSIDVVCTVDNAVLVGTHMADSTNALIINSLRAMAVAVALAVGYLNWTWPTYAFSGFAVIAFFGLFLRNHSISRLFFITISTLSFIGYGVWKTLALEDPPLLHVIGVILTVLLVLELLFLVAYTLRTGGNDPRTNWMLSNDVDLRLGTLTWITLTILCILGVITNWLAREFVYRFLPLVNFNSLVLRGALVTFGAGEIAALVSSTVYSLQGGPFYIADRWTYGPILHERAFRRVPQASPLTSASWIARFGHVVKRAAVAAQNVAIEKLENACNHIVRRLNNLWHTAVRIGNSVRRAVIKAKLHIIRSWRRFIVLNRWCAKWAWHIEIRYVKVFVIPLMLYLLGAICLYTMGELFFAYVHGGSALIPVHLLFWGVVVIIFFTIGTALLFHISLFSFFEKMLNALSVFGTSAFLFFVLSAWSLGIIGMLTGGPYRIGWVTIMSTLVLVVVFFRARRRPPNRESEG